MHKSLELYWKLYYENYSTEYIINEYSILRSYENQIIDGPIADIGCGQSKVLLEFLKSNRDLYAIDLDELQLEYLKTRVKNFNPEKLKSCHFLNLDIQKERIPERNYALIVCSNLLHFFSLAESKEILKLLNKNTIKGTFIYVTVHSNKHHSNKPDKIGKTGFKHFFSTDELNDLFLDIGYERIYLSDTVRESTSEETRFQNLWLDEWFRLNNQTDKDAIIKYKENHFKENNHANLEAIYKKSNSH